MGENILFFKSHKVPLIKHYSNCTSPRYNTKVSIELSHLSKSSLTFSIFLSNVFDSLEKCDYLNYSSDVRPLKFLKSKII